MLNKRWFPVVFLTLLLLGTPLVASRAAAVPSPTPTALRDGPLSSSVLCLCDGEQVALIQQVVNTHYNGVYGDGILAVGASYLDFIQDMPILSPRSTFSVETSAEGNSR